MRLAFVLCLTGCLASDDLKGSSEASSPYCPRGWKVDVNGSGGDGNCTPPTGYTALAWAELGGSGTYGFVRAATPGYLACAVSNPYEIPCTSRMVGSTEIAAYVDADVVDKTPRAGAIPIATTVSSEQGVYKLRLDPGQYRITGIDPFDGTRFWSANLTVVPQALAACPIDVYNSP